MNSNVLFVFSCVMIFSILGALSYQSIDDYVNFYKPLNQNKQIYYVDDHPRPNNSGDSGTVWRATILDADTIEIIFNNKHGYSHYRDGIKIWSIPETFEYTRIVKKGDIFINFCKINENGKKTAWLLGFEKITKDEMIIFNHYQTSLSSDVKCVHPDIIKHSFDIDWKTCIHHNQTFPKSIKEKSNLIRCSGIY